MFAKPTDHDWHNPGKIQLDTFFYQFVIFFQTTTVCIKKCPKKPVLVCTPLDTYSVGLKQGRRIMA